MGRDRARPYRGVEYAILLTAIVSMMLVSAFISELTAGWFRAISLVVVVAGIAAVSEHRMAIGLAVVLAGISMIDIVSPNTAHAVEISSAISVALDVLFIAGIIYHIAFEERMTRDLVIGAVCVYFLLGILWLHLYRWIHAASPDAFSGIAATGNAVRELMYFSYVTLTSLGYGDIVPLSPPARTLAVLEGTAGQLVLAIFVARVVGLQVSDRR